MLFFLRFFLILLLWFLKRLFFPLPRWGFRLLSFPATSSSSSLTAGSASSWNSSSRSARGSLMSATSAWMSTLDVICNGTVLWLLTDWVSPDIYKPRHSHCDQRSDNRGSCGGYPGMLKIFLKKRKTNQKLRAADQGWDWRISSSVSRWGSALSGGGTKLYSIISTSEQNWSIKYKEGCRLYIIVTGVGILIIVVRVVPIADRLAFN